MSKIKIYGSSDDLIEIEGDIHGEFNCWGDAVFLGNAVFLFVSDGSMLSVKYNGFWRITRIHKGSAEMSKHEGSDDETDYSDIVTLEGDIVWIGKGNEKASV